MKTYSSSFQQAMQAEVNILCTCWLLTFANGTKIGFTDFDRPLAIDDVTYQPKGGFQPSDIDRGLEFEPNQVALKSYFSQSLPEELITSGQLRGAKFFVFRANPLDLPNNFNEDPLTYDPLIRGQLGELTLTDRSYEVSVQGLQAGLSTTQGWVTSPTCRNKFCDELCGLDIEDWKDEIAIASVTSRQSFTVADSFTSERYTGANLIWQTGDNLGLEGVVIFSQGNAIGLLAPSPNPMQVGDVVDIERACDKSLETCWNSFQNGVHFNAEPGLPGEDVIAEVRRGDDDKA